MTGAFETGIYRNVFKECGYTEAEIEQRVEDTFRRIFHGTKEECFYHEVGEDMAYVEDTGNHDVRTEGMSYGMMVCVQLDRKEEFDRLWKWARTYMYLEGGSGHNYFAWSCAVDGSKNAEGPAPEGEEFFAMALFFASNRWGDGDGIFAYSKEARAILSECIHKGEEGHPGEPMWNPDLHLIKFITNVEFTDPSYHLPHFYELFYCFHNYHHYDSHYEKHSYDCQNPDNPYFPTCICYFLVKSIIISWIYQPFTKSNIPHEWSHKKIYEIMLKSTIL